MKKLITAIAALMLAVGIVSAVQSVNTVGFVIRGFDAGAGEFMANIGVPLKCMGVADGSYAVTNKLFDYQCQAGDLVYVFNPGNWDLDGYQYKGLGKGWSVSWSDGTATLEPSFVVPVGANLFFQPTDGTSALTISGEVKASGMQQVVFDPEGGTYWSWPIANPFPIATTLADIETFALAGDLIYVFNPMNWDLDGYQYKGAGKGWAVSWSDGTVSLIKDSATVLFPVGTGGFFMPNGDNAIRTWSVILNYN